MKWRALSQWNKLQVVGSRWERYTESQRALSQGPEIPVFQITLSSVDCATLDSPTQHLGGPRRDDLYVWGERSGCWVGSRAPSLKGPRLAIPKLDCTLESPGGLLSHPKPRTHLKPMTLQYVGWDQALVGLEGLWVRPMCRQVWEPLTQTQKPSLPPKLWFSLLS